MKEIPMKSLVKLLLVSLGLLFAAACQATSPNPIDGIVDLQEIEVEILAVKPEKDGNTLVVRDDSGNTYNAVISIPNLGPESDFDFDHLKVGNRMIVTGETWSLAGDPQLTIRDAKAV
ncbi:hypothetical protein [Falsiruegeria mediterranea]